ncbi:ABC transporter ATP-binding protein [Aureimonas ureilytica]|uniref:ABC transporter ATP-binding protein n=1 Tax=Aureimonas ureilytica TaxID=401562 RepID=A0A175R8C1_9HYPH|nr:thiol reductant ABC exporter subunit CydC [Aureimonas ureilytica]KTQ95795.1 ABC transporter ATP-binding protein [Aureimonas ureilytica]
MSALRRFAPVFAQSKGRFVLTLALSLLTLLSGAALLALSGWFLTSAFLATAAVSFNLFGPSSAVRGLSLVRILSRYGEKLVGHDATLRTLGHIRAETFRTAIPRFGTLRKELTRGDLVQRLTADVEALDVIFLLAIGPMVTGLLAGGALALALVFLLPGAALAYALAFGLATVAVPLALARASREPGAQGIEALASLRGNLIDAIDGQADLHLFGAIPDARQRLESGARHLSASRRWLAAQSALATGAIHLLSGAALIGVLMPGLAALRGGQIGGPVLVGLVLAVLGSFEAVAGTVRSVARLGTSRAAAERLDALADLPETLATPARPAALPAGATLSLREVSFAPRGARPVLDGASLALKAGERIALTGPSGCGKSTLLAIAMGLLRPDRGRVEIAGQDMARMGFETLRQRVTLLEQDAPVFLGTIAENLRIGRSDATDDELWDALRRARLHSFVANLPQELETPLGEGGRTLSAGQARRLVLARALLSPAPILLLDEPTSGLDPETEQAFLLDLAEATEGRSVILATHANLPDGAMDRVLHLHHCHLTSI